MPGEEVTIRAEFSIRPGKRAEVDALCAKLGDHACELRLGGFSAAVSTDGTQLQVKGGTRDVEKLRAALQKMGPVFAEIEPLAQPTGLQVTGANTLPPEIRGALGELDAVLDA